jgi:bisphosphoglycerate-independent phosphoglycerate mutase (AlkP superfamily)
MRQKKGMQDFIKQRPVEKSALKALVPDQEAAEVKVIIKGVEQPNLFGDQDFVFNVLQTEITGIREQIEAAEKSIERKETLIEALEARKQEVEKAAKIIADQKKAMEKSHGK